MSDPTPTPPPEYTDTAGASEFTRIPIATLRTMRSRGGGPPCSKIGNSVRYAYSDLRAWMDAHKEPTQ